MYKILFNLTRKDCNFLRLSEVGFTLSRMAPFATLDKITPVIEQNLKDGLIIDVLGNTGVVINEELQAHNEKVLEYFNIAVPTKTEEKSKEEVKVEEPKVETVAAIIEEPKKEEKPKTKKNKAKDSENK